MSEAEKKVTNRNGRWSTPMGHALAERDDFRAEAEQLRAEVERLRKEVARCPHARLCCSACLVCDKCVDVMEQLAARESTAEHRTGAAQGAADIDRVAGGAQASAESLGSVASGEAGRSSFPTFEEWHAQNCPLVTCTIGACRVPSRPRETCGDGSYRFGNGEHGKGAPFAGRTCREVYEREKAARDPKRWHLCQHDVLVNNCDKCAAAAASGPSEGALPTSEREEVPAPTPMGSPEGARPEPSQQRQPPTDLHDRAMDEIHRAAGIERDGLVNILGWIADVRAALVLAEDALGRRVQSSGLHHHTEAVAFDAVTAILSRSTVRQ